MIDPSPASNVRDPRDFHSSLATSVYKAGGEPFYWYEFAVFRKEKGKSESSNHGLKLTLCQFNPIILSKNKIKIKKLEKKTQNKNKIIKKTTTKDDRKQYFRKYIKIIENKSYSTKKII